MISEKKAWRKIANAFRPENLCRYDVIRGTMGCENPTGICGAIIYVGVGRITRNRMELKIRRALRGRRWLYPLTKPGHAKRVQFCLRKARACK